MMTSRAGDSGRGWPVALLSAALVVALSAQWSAGARPPGQVQKTDLSRAQRTEAMRKLGQGRWDPWWHKAVKPASLGEDVKLPAAYVRAGCVPFSADWQARILPGTVPAGEDVGRRATVVMARNEFEPAVVGVHALTDLKDVTVSLSPLTGAGGKLSVEADIRLTEYIRRGKGGPWAIRLWPAFPVNIPKGLSQEFWITLRTAIPASKAGRYTGTVTIAHSAGKAELPIQVEVLDLQLRSMNDSYRLGYFDSPYVCPGPLTVKALAEHNMNMHSKWMGGWLPKVTYADGEFSFSFDAANHREFDAFMRQAKVAGFTGPMFNFLGPPSNMFVGNNHPRKLYLERIISPAVKEPVEKGTLTGKMKQGYQETIGFMEGLARKNDWPVQAWSPFDEPVKYVWIGDHVRTKFIESCKAIQEVGAISFGDIHHLTKWRGSEDCGYVFTKVMDYFCTNNIREDPDHALEKIRRDNPKCTLFLYRSGSWGVRTDTSRYQAGFYGFAFQAKGTYLWHFSSAVWLGPKAAKGDNEKSTSAFQCAYGLVPSPAFEGAREAGDDMRYVATYERTARDSGIDPEKFLGPIRTECRRLRGAGGRDALSDFRSTVRDARRLNAIRMKIAREALRLKGR